MKKKHKAEMRKEWPRCSSCRQLLTREQAEAAGFVVLPPRVDWQFRDYVLERQYKIKRMNEGFV